MWSGGNPTIANGAVTSAKILDGTVAAADIALESITSSQLATDSVQATEIADDSIDSGEISNDSLGAQDLAPDSVGNSELQDNAVNSANVVNNSLTTADIDGTDSNGSISLGAGSVANGRCKSYDITVGGSVAGDIIVISTRAALPAGLMIYGQQAPANGHGIMTVCNLSGAAMPALTNFPIRTVTFR